MISNSGGVSQGSQAPILGGGVGVLTLFLLMGAGLAAYLLLPSDDDNEVTVETNPGDGVEILGTPFDDTLIGTTGADRIEGNDGNDRLFGDFDDDTLMGQTGSDTLVGDAGDDILYGGTQGDLLGVVIEGGESREEDFEQMAGNDTLFGGDDPDKIFDMRGSNTFYGGRGNDTIDARDTRESRSGGFVPDLPRTPDIVFGDDGNDTLYLDDGDVASGGVGQDVFDVRFGSNLVDDLDETYVTITDFDIQRDTLLIDDPNGVFEARGEVTFESDAENRRIWVLGGENRLVLLTGNGFVLTDELRDANIRINSPFGA